MFMVWYGMVNVDLYSAIITKVSNALDTLVSGEKPGFQVFRFYRDSCCDIQSWARTEHLYYSD